MMVLIAGIPLLVIMCWESSSSLSLLPSSPTDYRDRWYYKDVSPFMRIAKLFREDGLLLPFGHPRIAFDIPNPFNPNFNYLEHFPTFLRASLWMTRPIPLVDGRSWMFNKHHRLHYETGTANCLFTFMP